jgi:hypothetical protein
MQTEVFDIEVYRDYLLIGFRNVVTNVVTAFEQYPGTPLDVRAVKRHMATRRLVSFNGKRFDAPIVALALTGADCKLLKQASDSIIARNLQPWQFEQSFECSIPDWDHIDLFDVAPGVATSLKIYAGRMHSRRMQDLPIEHDASIGPAERERLRDYCLNSDTVATLDLWNALQPQIDLRIQMTDQYGIDLRSKSDAQVAEAVIKSRVGEILAKKIERPTIEPGTGYRYRPPFFIHFDHPELRAALDMIVGTEFYVGDSGAMLMPKEISKLKLRLGTSVYQMGIGGLHSTESSVAHVADEDTMLVDRDVASYYPAIILGCNLYPKHLGPAFVRVYRSIVQRRLDAKHKGDKVTADALKITINGTFGKLGSKWSALYSPDLMIQVTLTGQLSLLMLIESLEREGISVVSANTDGIVIKCPRHLQGAMDACVWTWEQMTGFDTEAVEYRALYSRDVNNYIAVKLDGSAKLKGVYAPAGLMKNPANEIAAEAAREFLKRGTPVAQTIEQCNDIRKFVTIRQVKGGGVDQAGNYLGRAVRWYYSTAVEGPLRYKVNGYTVARSDGAKALMDLPDTIPADLDRAWYVREAESILRDVGFAPMCRV